MDLDHLADLTNLSLTWVGFGTAVGLLARAVAPTRDSGGAIAFVLMGIAGALVGCACLQFFHMPEKPIQPISYRGFLVGFLGSLTVLVMYRILGGTVIDGEWSGYRRRKRRRREQVFFDEVG